MSEKPIKMNWENLDLLIKALRAEFKMSKLHIFSWGFEKHESCDTPKPFIRCEKHNLIKKLYLDDAVNSNGEVIGSIEAALKWEWSEKQKNNTAGWHVAKVFNDQFENKVKALVCCQDKE